MTNTIVQRRSWGTPQPLRSAIFEHIETFYSRRRRHCALGYLTPDE